MSKRTVGIGLSMLVCLALAPAVNGAAAKRSANAKPNAKVLVTRQVIGGTEWAGPIAPAKSPLIGPGVIYTNNVSSGYFYPQQAPTVVWDDIALNTTDTRVAVSQVTVGIVQQTLSPDTTVDILWSTTTATSPYLTTPGTLVCSVPLAGNTGGSTILSTVTCGDGVTTISGMENIPLDQTFDPGLGGFFAIGVRLSNIGTSPNRNGWQLTTGPDFNEDAMWVEDPVAGTTTFSWFGGPPNPSATFYAIVSGVTTVPVNLQKFKVE